MATFHYLTPRPTCDEANPFGEDKLGREETARKLTEFLDTFVHTTFTLGLNGIWGSGKTYFIERWQAQLRNEGYQTLRFNAWENDFADDPFAALLNEFRQLASTENEANRFNKLFKAGVPILKRVAAGVVKNLTSGVIDIQNQDIEKLIAECAEDVVSHAIAKSEEQRDCIRLFREELERFVQDQPQAGAKPIYYFIDELDRCRPTFAISVLERVKHLLQVKGIVFVFAWDRSQLNSTIRSVYGRQTSVNGYLLRFVDLEYDLPQGNATDLIKQLLSRHNLTEFLIESKRASVSNELVENLELYTKSLSLSIRELEKAITILAIYVRTCRDFIDLACLLAGLRVKKPDFYNRIRSCEDDYDKLLMQDLPNVLGRATWGLDRMGGIEGCLLYHRHAAQNRIIPVTEDKLRGLDSLALCNAQSHARAGNLRNVYQYLATNYRMGAVRAVIKQFEFATGFH